MALWACAWPLAAGGACTPRAAWARASLGRKFDPSVRGHAPPQLRGVRLEQRQEMTGDGMVPTTPSCAPHACAHRREGGEIRRDRSPHLPGETLLPHRTGECAQVAAVALEKDMPHDFPVLTIEQPVVIHSPQGRDEQRIGQIDQMARGPFEGTVRIGMTDPPCQVVRRPMCRFEPRRSALARVGTRGAGGKPHNSASHLTERTSSSGRLDGLVMGVTASITVVRHGDSAALSGLEGPRPAPYASARHLERSCAWTLCPTLAVPGKASAPPW